jgi:hypothetical protein
MYSCQSNFEFEYLSEFVTEFRNILGYKLTLNLTAVGESAHTVFEGLILKKLFIVKNLKKICNPCLISPEHFVLKAFL